MNIGDIERVNELARSRVSRMRDQIGFGKAWGCDLPGVGFDGNMMFEQRAGFGASVESLLELALFGLESAVDGSGTDRDKLLLRFGRDRQALDGPREPSRQQSLEAGGTRIAGRLPDGRQRRDHLGTVSGTTSFGVGLGFLWGWTAQQADGVFAVVTADLAELVEDASSQGLGSFLVTEVNCFEIIPSRFPTHETVTLPAL